MLTKQQQGKQIFWIHGNNCFNAYLRKQMPPFYTIKAAILSALFVQRLQLRGEQLVLQFILIFPMNSISVQPSSALFPSKDTNALLIQAEDTLLKDLFKNCTGVMLDFIFRWPAPLCFQLYIVFTWSKTKWMNVSPGQRKKAVLCRSGQKRIEPKLPDSS